MPKINALVAGSTGYIGIQLVKLLVKHKYVNIKYLCGNSSVGKKISNFDKSCSEGFKCKETICSSNFCIDECQSPLSFAEINNVFASEILPNLIKISM